MEDQRNQQTRVVNSFQEAMESDIKEDEDLAVLKDGKVNLWIPGKLIKLLQNEYNKPTHDARTRTQGTGNQVQNDLS